MTVISPLHWVGKRVAIEGKLIRVASVRRVDNTEDEYLVRCGTIKKIRETIRIKVEQTDFGQVIIRRIRKSQKRQRHASFVK